MVVSATPVEALEREWAEHGLAQYMNVIAGQEMGTKAQHIEYAAKGKYADDNILLIGDAPGDRDAAKATGVLYYPINPGREEQSWKRFHDEALDRFLTGGIRGRVRGGADRRVRGAAARHAAVEAMSREESASADSWWI